MRITDIRLLYDYNYWANERILGRAEEVTAEQIGAPAPFPSGSLIRTLLHILGAEWIWLERWQGDSPTAVPDASSFPTIDAIRQRWRLEEDRMRAFIAGLSDEDLDRIVAYRTTRGVEDARPLWQLMLHVVNHGTQHRSEAAAMLTGYGRSPGDIDLSLFLRER